MEIGIDDLDFNEDDLGITPVNPNHTPEGNVDDDGDPIKPWIEPTNPIEPTPPSRNQDGDNPPPPEDKDIITLLLEEKY